MAKISIGDAELSVDVQGNAEPLLLVSGLGGTASFWSQQVQPFAKHFKVITHDHRGTGASTLSKISYSVSQIADDVLRLMDAMSLPRVALVGHSTGGAVAQYLAINHPDRLRRIVLSASWAGPNEYFVTLFQHRRSILERLGGEAFSVDGILRAFPADTLIERPEILASVATNRQASFPGVEIMSSRIGAVLGHDQRSNLHRIDLPTLVICAQDDLITPAPFSDELAAKIDGAESVRLAHGGHFVPQVHARDYNEAVLAFLLKTDEE